MNRINVFTLALLLGAAIGNAAYAKTADSYSHPVRGADLCTRAIALQEHKYAIPAHLLAAIASVESGTRNKTMGIKSPWPWTVGGGGRSYYLNSKEEAVATVERLQSQGIENINIGCMQINLPAHEDDFTDLEQAFEPADNVAYGAKLLRQNFDREHSWRKATADYKSYRSAKGTKYAALVYRQWRRMAGEIRTQ